MRLKNPRLHNQIQELKTRIKLFENCSPDKKNELWKDNFTDIGRMWGTLLDLPDIPPEKVGLMMVCLKACREKYQHKLDNLTDGAGFFKTIQLIKEKQ
jgi:hypothetical protein